MRTLSRTRALLLALTAFIPLAACGDSNGPALEDPGTIRVINMAQGPILFLFFRTCGAGLWGQDRLPDAGVGSTIAPQDSSSFTVETGCYDLRADLCPVSTDCPVHDTVAVVLPEANVTSLQPFRWEVQPAPQAPESRAPR
ncbi:MAG: hypothetical protein ACRELC_11725 [Gemmatimonadota bacterium]